MVVSFNPAISFKSETNLISKKMQEQGEKSNTITIPDVPELNSPVRYPSSWSDKYETELNEKAQKTINKQLEFIKKQDLSFEETLKDKDWEKRYYKEGNFVHVRQNGVYDGKEFEIYEDGKVIKVSTWTPEPKVVKEPNEPVAKIFNKIKNGEEITDSDVGAINGNYMVSEKTKAQLFHETLNDHQWKKEYLPESDIIVIRHKKIKDGIDYMMEKDGTVKEFGLRVEPTVIIEPSVEGAKEFGKLKAKLNHDAAHKEPTSLWYKMKKGVANIWKFFSVTGTMGVATAKGVAEGAVVGSATFALAFLTKGIYKIATKQAKAIDVIKNPIKTAGKAGGALAITSLGIVLAYELIKGRMKANQNSAVIEHKMDVEHELT